MQQPVLVTQRRWQNQPLVRERDTGSVRWLWRLVATMAVIAIPMAIYLHLHGQSIRLAYEASALRAEQDSLIEQERRLRIERARLESLERVEHWADVEGLVVPGAHQVVVIESVPPSGPDADR